MTEGNVFPIKGDNDPLSPYNSKTRNDSWKNCNLSQYWVPAEINEMMTELLEDSKWPEYSSKGRIVQDAIHKLYVLRKGGTSDLVKRYERVQKANRGLQWYQEDLITLETFKQRAGFSRSDETKKILQDEIKEIYKSFHPDLQQELSHIARNIGLELS